MNISPDRVQSALGSHGLGTHGSVGVCVCMCMCMCEYVCVCVFNFRSNSTDMYMEGYVHVCTHE